LARLFNDGANTYYDAAEAKNNSVPFGKINSPNMPGKPIVNNTNGAYEPFNYGDAATMLQQADNTLVGNMRDCGECHVGGGGMEYIPRNEGWDETATGGRVPFRGIAQDKAQYTSFNYYIDVFDDDGDGDRMEVLFNDFAKTGVMEVDCLTCHLEGYSWDAAKAAKREGRFDASRAFGAGMGTPYASYDEETHVYTPLEGLGFTDANENVLPAGYGTTVVYDLDKVDVAADGTLKLGSAIGTMLQGTPPTENCASCHQGKYQVDWKKRGEMSASTDVHAGIGCMGCHQRTGVAYTDYKNADGAVTTPKGDPVAVGTSLNIRDGKLGHDPAKGGAGQWDSLNNKNDWREFKTCKDCHYSDGDVGFSSSFGAPNAEAAHAAAGLSDKIVQKGTRGAQREASHLDIISCEACHITKSSPVSHSLDGGSTTETYASGGCFVDGTGPDHEGRLATHDTKHVSRPMYTNEGINFGYTWANDGKIHPGNFLTSLFWRDKNDVDYDVNVDGRAHGMDALLPTHILPKQPTKSIRQVIRPPTPSWPTASPPAPRSQRTFPI
jgi:hypothetical protein